MVLSAARTLLHDASGRAVLFAFALNSLIFGNWVTRIPDIQARLGLTESALGLGLLAIPLGSILAVVLGSHSIDRFGPGRSLVASATLLCAVAPILALAPTFAAFSAVAFIFGLGNGLMDVSMNAEAVAIEHRLGRRVIATCHGGYSLGGMLGAGVGSLAAGAGMAPALHLGLAGGVLALAVLVARRLYTDLPHRRTTARGPLLALPRPPLVGLALVAGLVLIAESAVADWSALYLRQALGAGAGIGGLGYVAFSGTMAVGRFLGDGVAERIGSARAVAYGLGGGIFGLTLTLFAHAPSIAIWGFACIGLGLSGVVPSVFRAGAVAPGTSPSVGVASVASAGYIGIVCQPLLVGTLSERWSMTVAFGVVLGALVLAVFLVIPAFRRAAPPDERKRN